MSWPKRHNNSQQLGAQVRAGRQAAAARSGAQEALAGSLAGLTPSRARERLAAAIAALRTRAAALAAGRQELPDEVRGALHI